MIRDGYKEFFEHFNIPDELLLEFGLKSVITIDKTKAKFKWEQIKFDLVNNKKLYIRGYGRDSSGTQLFIDLYSELFSNQYIVKDQTNNYNPQKQIENLTGLKRNTDIFNYQVSHVFGKTKNPLTFNAPWNIIFIPKVLDPFTGHESKGSFTTKFTTNLKISIYEQYYELIEDYNDYITKENIVQRGLAIIPTIASKWNLDSKKADSFVNSFVNEFEKIGIDKLEIQL